MNKQIIEEAAEWFVEFTTDEPERARKQAFDDWLRKSPEHVRCYLELLPLWEDAALQSAGESQSAEELIALGRGSDAVIAWNDLKDTQARSPPSPLSSGELHAMPLKTDSHNGRGRWLHTRSHRFALAASVVVAMLVVGGVFWSLRIRGEIYSTGVGEQRGIQLADGSSIELNTDSRVRVHFGDHRRDVELTQGQALFHVAKDAARPFVVASRSARIRAVGTEFDVYRRSSGTTVTVLEGKVAVLSAERDADSSAAVATPVSAGEQMTIDGPMVATASSRPKRTDVDTATAWTHHRLLFDATPLPDVATEFNRYNRRRLIVEDGSLRDFNVSGSFSSTDPASLVRFLEAQRGLIVREGGDGIYISRQ